MTPPVTTAEDEHAVAGSTSRCRVAVREIGENVGRALVASGVSSGEAAVIAGAVGLSQIHFDAGVDRVLAAMSEKLDCRVPVSCRSAGVIDVLDDPEGRSALLLGPMAAALVAARPAGSPVLVSGARLHAVWSGLLATHCGASSPSFFALEATDGAFRRGVRADPDGGHHVLTANELRAVTRDNPRLRSAAESADGVLVLSDFGPLCMPLGPASLPADVVLDQRQQAWTSGLMVPASEWESLCRLASNYLVPGE